MNTSTTTQNAIVSAVSDLEELDHEVPGMPDYTGDFTYEILAPFEVFNSIKLEGEALELFHTYAEDYYTES